MFNKKKKERTPEQVKFRLIFALSLLGAMLLFVIFAPSKKGEDRNKTIAAAMDAQLDTLLRNRYGDYELTGMMPFEESYEEPQVAVEIRGTLEALKTLEGTPLAGALRMKLDSLRKELDALENPTVELSYIRRISFRNRGSELTGFQKTDSDLARSELIYVTEVYDVKPLRDRIDTLSYLKEQNDSTQIQ